MLKEWVQSRLVAAEILNLSDGVLRAQSLGDLISLLSVTLGGDAGRHAEKLYRQENEESQDRLSSMRDILEIIQSTENHGVFRLRNIHDLAKGVVDRSNKEVSCESGK